MPEQSPQNISTNPIPNTEQPQTPVNTISKIPTATVKQVNLPVIISLLFLVFIISFLVLLFTGNLNKIENKLAEVVPQAASTSVLVATPSSVLDTPTPTSPVPTEIPFANITGVVTDSYNGKPQSGMKIIFQGVQNFTAITSLSGVYELTQIPLGNYTIQAKNDLRSSSSQSITVSNSKPITQNIAVSLISPKPSKLTGYVYEDLSNNFKREPTEKLISAQVSIYKYVKGGFTEKVDDVLVGESGKFTYSLNGPAKYLVVARNKTFYSAPENKEIDVSGLGEDISLDIDYHQLASSAGVVIYVFNDRNSNSIRDDGEENIHYQAVTVINSQSSEVSNYAVPPTGMELTSIDFGTYSFSLSPENESWQFYYPVTKANAQIEVGPQSVKQTVYLGAHKLENP